MFGNTSSGSKVQSTPNNTIVCKSSSPPKRKLIRISVVLAPRRGRFNISNEYFALLIEVNGRKLLVEL